MRGGWWLKDKEERVVVWSGINFPCHPQHLSHPHRVWGRCVCFKDDKQTIIAQLERIQFIPSLLHASLSLSHMLQKTALTLPVDLCVISVCFLVPVHQSHKIRLTMLLCSSSQFLSRSASNSYVGRWDSFSPSALWNITDWAEMIADTLHNKVKPQCEDEHPRQCERRSYFSPWRVNVIYYNLGLICVVLVTDSDELIILLYSPS